MEIKLGSNFKREFDKNLGSFEWYPSEAKKDATAQSLEEIEKEPAGSFY